MADANLRFKFLADARDFLKDNKKVQKGLGQTGKATKGASKGFGAMKGAILGVGAVMGAAKLKDFALGAVESAKDFGESVNAVKVATGDAADSILELGKGAAKSMGLSKTAVNEAAVAFSAFTAQIAGEGGDSGQIFEDLAMRATDFGSVLNMETADALAKFRSGLAGESEPLRAFGIDVSAAATNLFALESGLIKTGEKMTESQKVQARYGLIMKQTAKFAGDFANTSGDLAGQQKILDAEMENARIELGEKMLPVMLEATKLGITLVEGIDDVGKAYQVWGTRFKTVIGTVTKGDQAWAKYNSTVNYSNELIEDGRRKGQVYAEMLKDMAPTMGLTVDLLEEMQRGLGLTNDEMRDAIIQFHANADAIGLTNSQLELLDELFRSIPPEVALTDGALYDMEQTAAGAAGQLNGLATASGRVLSAAQLLRGEINLFDIGGSIQAREDLLADLMRSVAGGRLIEGTDLTAVPKGGPAGGNIIGGGVVEGADFQGASVNINVTTGVGDPAEIGRGVVDALQVFQRTNGPLPLDIA